MTQIKYRPLTTLIRNRFRELNVKRVDVVKRMGYSNIAKGLRRLDEFGRDDYRSFPALKSRLATALDVSTEELDDAFQKTRQEIIDEDEAEYRKNFQPHLIWDTAYKTPTPIFVAAMCGAYEKMCRVFIEGSDPRSYVDQAKKMIPGAFVPGFGKVVGFYINYSPDQSIRYSPDGEPIEHLPKAKRRFKAVMKW